MEGNASVNQVYTVSCVTDEKRAGLLRAWGLGSNKKERGTGGATQSARENYISFKETNCISFKECTNLSCISCKSNTSEEGTEYSKWWGGAGLYELSCY